MMKQSLDKLSGLEAWRLTIDEAFNNLLKSTTDMMSRLHDLQARPPSPPSPHPHQPHPYLHTSQGGGFDLSTAPQPATPTSSLFQERSTGHGFDSGHQDVGNNNQQQNLNGRKEEEEHSTKRRNWGQLRIIYRCHLYCVRASLRFQELARLVLKTHCKSGEKPDMPVWESSQTGVCCF